MRKRTMDEPPGDNSHTALPIARDAFLGSEAFTLLGSARFYTVPYNTRKLSTFKAFGASTPSICTPHLPEAAIQWRTLPWRPFSSGAPLRPCTSTSSPTSGPRVTRESLTKLGDPLPFP